METKKMIEMESRIPVETDRADVKALADVVFEMALRLNRLEDEVDEYITKRNQKPVYFYSSNSDGLYICPSGVENGYEITFEELEKELLVATKVFDGGEELRKLCDGLRRVADFLEENWEGGGK